jgi:type IV pilus assembly protein PilA
MNGLRAAASAWNAQYGGVGATSKYVDSLIIKIPTGEIVITYSADLSEVSGKTLVLTPNLPPSAPLVNGLTGTIEWACSSTSNAAAMAQGFWMEPKGTVPTQYAPPQCQ